MLRFLPLALILGFFAELAVMIAVGQRIGVLATLFLVLVAAMLGGSVIRAAGVSMVEAMRRGGAGGRFATRDAASRFLLVPAGLLLIVPGFISDVMGLALLLPPVRGLLASRLATRVDIRASGWTAANGNVIEGEATEITGEILGPEETRNDRR